MSTDEQTIITDITTTTVDNEQTLFEDDFLDVNEIDEVDEINNLPLLDMDEKLPDIELKSVKEIQLVLGNLSYETIRKVLYKKYGLIVKDDVSIKNLYMITYNKKENQKKYVKLTLDDEKLLDEYRGLILEKDTNKLLCYTFDRMHRRIPDEWDLKDCTVTQTYDGSQIKIFYHETNKMWVTSTTRKINASNAYFFSNKSFLEMFCDASHNLNWNKLDKKCCYSFVLSHPDNRIIEKHNKPYITHVLTRDMTTLEHVLDDNIGVLKPTVVNVLSKKDLFNKMGFNQTTVKGV